MKIKKKQETNWHNLAYLDKLPSYVDTALNRCGCAIHLIFSTGDAAPLLNWSTLKPLIFRAITNGCRFEHNHIPAEWIDRDVVIRHLAETGSIAGAPAELLTPDICEEAVQINDRNFRHVPLHHQTTQMCWRALTQSGYWLLCVSQRLYTEDMLHAALDKTPRLIIALLEASEDEAPETEHVRPLDLVVALSDSDIKEAVLKNPLYIFPRLPSIFVTADLAANVVARFPELLTHVDTTYQTTIMCENAVLAQPSMIRVADFQTLNMCLHAVRTNGEFFTCLRKPWSSNVEIQCTALRTARCKSKVLRAIIKNHRIRQTFVDLWQAIDYLTKEEAKDYMELLHVLPLTPGKEDCQLIFQEWPHFSVCQYALTLQPQLAHILPAKIFKHWPELKKVHCC